MPKFFFNNRFADEFISDRGGRELPSLAAPQGHASDVPRHLLTTYGLHWREAELHIVQDRQEVTMLRLSDLIPA